MSIKISYQNFMTSHFRQTWICFNLSWPTIDMKPSQLVGLKLVFSLSILKSLNPDFLKYSVIFSAAYTHISLERIPTYKLNVCSSAQI